MKYTCMERAISNEEEQAQGQSQNKREQEYEEPEMSPNLHFVLLALGWRGSQVTIRGVW